AVIAPRLEELFTMTVPPLMVLAPEYVFTAASVSAPAPLFVNPPVPLTTPFSTTLLDPLTVSPKPPLVKVPDKVSVPASDAMVDADPSVRFPLQELLPLMFRRAPSLEMPPPLSVKPSAPTAMPP